MNFKIAHENYNVSDLEKSLAFYKEALGLHECRRKESENFTIVYVKNDSSDFELELTWLKDHPQKYDLGECEFHLAFVTDDYEGAYKSTVKWAASALKTKRWVYISSKIRMATGWKSFRQNELCTYKYKSTPGKQVCFLFYGVYCFFFLPAVCSCILVLYM